MGDCTVDVLACWDEFRADIVLLSLFIAVSENNGYDQDREGRNPNEAGIEKERDEEMEKR